MRKTTIVVLLITLVFVIALIGIMSINQSSLPALASERVTIPGIDISFQIPKGYKAHYYEDAGLLTINSYPNENTRPSIIALPVFFQPNEEKLIADQQDDYVQDKLVTDGYKLESKIFDEITIYQANYTERSEKEVILASNALITYDEQGIHFSITSSPKDRTIAQKILTAILLSLEIEK